MKYILIVAILLGCSGYKLRSKKNPFSQFGITSLSIPMFYNFSNLPNVSPIFTKKIFNKMLSYKELKIYSGNKPTDAVLVGIIDSRDKRKNTVTPENQKSVFNTYGEEIFEDKREEFLLPTTNKIRLRLRIIIIKHPTKEELDFLKKSIGSTALSSKIIFNETIDLTETYNIKENKEEGIQVLGTQNRGVQQGSIESLAEKAAASFEDMILYAF